MRTRRGMLGWFRKKLLPACARLLTLFAFLLVLAWCLGHLFTDRFYLTQFLWWLPTIVILALAWPSVFLAWALEKLSTRLGGFQLRPIITLSLAAISLFALFGQWHLHRYFLSTPAGQLRLIYWNLAVDEHADNAGQIVLQHKPDIAIVANPRWDADRSPLLEALGSLGVPPPPESSTNRTSLLFKNDIIIATKGSITRWGSVRFDVGSGEAEDRGLIMFLQLAELTEKPLTLWVVDMPSGPWRWRQKIMRQARDAIAAWKGPAFELDDIGRWVPTALDQAFPEPDLVVGDFNTPRSSDSLDHLTEGLTETFAAAGFGRGATWPSQRPIFPIDLAFVRPQFRVIAERILNPGVGRHRPIVVDLATR